MYIPVCPCCFLKDSFYNSLRQTSGHDFLLVQFVMVSVESRRYDFKENIWFS